MFPSVAGLNFQQLDGGFNKGVNENKEQFLHKRTSRRLGNIKK